MTIQATRRKVIASMLWKAAVWQSGEEQNQHKGVQAEDDDGGGQRVAVVDPE